MIAEDMETVTLTIDGRQITVEKGKTVLQAAIEHGISVPYYCYHPGISIDGSCRVCIVKIEKMPKLQTSCSTVCTDGMVVSTRTPDVVEARAGVFEFLLINHPLDCPVCDKGGECPLQDFSYTFGPDQSRMEFPRRIFDGDGVKGDVDFGPTLMLNRQRCILCTRCVRFMRDIDGDAQINIIDRGYGSEIATFQEEGVHSLISGNLMDVCPVGAITTRDYRFKSRPWDNPNAADTICTQCEKGCNVTVWIKAQARMGEGLAAGAVDAAVQPRRQQLLDVRHRPVQLPLDRGRGSSAPAARSGTRHGVLRAGLLARRDRQGAPIVWPPRAPRIRTASGSCCRRMPRTKSCSSSAASPRSCSGRTARPAVSGRLALSAEGATERQPVQGAAGRRTECQRRPHLRIRARPESATTVGEADLSALKKRRRRRPRVGVVRLRSGTRRLARFGRLDCSTRARKRQAAAAHRAGCPADRSGAARPISCCRVHRSSRRKRLIPTSRDGCRRPRGPFPFPAKRWRIGRFSSTSGPRSACRSITRSAAQMRADIAARFGDAGLDGIAALSVQPAGAGAPLAAGIESVGAVEVGFHVPGSAAREGRPSIRRRCRCRPERFSSKK